jgi:HD superfamily phosphodiesterase
MSEFDSAENRHHAAVRAAELLDRLDDEMIAAHTRVVEAATAYGMLLGKAGLEPAVVLGQMLQSVSVAFTSEIIPHYRRVPKDAESS